MGDSERKFELVLEELRQLLKQLVDKAQHIILVGGQALALESKALGGDGELLVNTASGITVTRGYTMEPDLLLDVDALGRYGEDFSDALQERGFKHTRTFAWEKRLGEDTLTIDLFRLAEADVSLAPTGTTVLPAGELAVRKTNLLKIHLKEGVLEIRVPDPLGFIAMKIEAKGIRPQETKDSFDIYACIAHKGPEVVAESLLDGGGAGAEVLSALLAMFGSTESEGVKDILASQPYLDENESALIAQAVVDLFEELDEIYSGLKGKRLQ